MKNRFYGVQKTKSIKPRSVGMAKYYTMKLVEAYPAVKDGKDGYKVVYKDGYVSWCPKAVFEASSLPAENIAW
jgi:hypothetical protein